MSTEDLEFIEERLANVLADLAEIDERLKEVKKQHDELLARRRVLSLAKTSLAQKRGHLRKQQSPDRELVDVDVIAPYLAQYLANEPRPYIALKALADRAGVSLALMEKVRYRSGKIEFRTADRIFAALGLPHVLDEADIELRW